MNKRIQELAEQTGFYVAMFDPSNKENARIEKFAFAQVIRFTNGVNRSNTL